MGDDKWIAWLAISSITTKKEDKSNEFMPIALS